MKTIAQQLGVTDFPFVIKDKRDNVIYREYSDGFWYKSEYDSEDNTRFYIDSGGFGFKVEYNAEGYTKKIYFENSDGVIKENRPKKDDVITINGIKYKRIDE